MPGDRNADMRMSKTSLRASKENPIPEEDDDRVEVGKLEPARNTEEVDGEEQEEYYDEEDEEYDEEYE